MLGRAYCFIIFVFVHGGLEILFMIALYRFCVWVIRGCALDHVGLVLVWTGVQLAGEVGVGSWVLRAVLHISSGSSIWTVSRP